MDILSKCCQTVVMPRQGRLHIPGGYYHVIGRGLERRRVFAGNDDKNDFLERLGEGLERSQCQCLAWAVMSNHYHLLIRVSSTPLSKLMSPLLSCLRDKVNGGAREGALGYDVQSTKKKKWICLSKSL